MSIGRKLNNFKHGHTDCRGNVSPEYHTWRNMKTRCTNPKANNYPRYGGRGIRVCARWESFANFIEDMGLRPPGHSIDRIDSDGDYSPENCRWATAEAQQNNKRNNVYHNYGGEKLTVPQIARKVGAHPKALWACLNDKGLDLNSAIVEAIRIRGTRKHFLDGKQIFLRDAAELTGLSFQSLRHCIYGKGLTLEQATEELKRRSA